MDKKLSLYKDILKFYNSKFLCTYTSFNDDDTSNLCYQIQLLLAFNLQKYNQQILTESIEKLYLFFKKNKEIIEIIEFIGSNFEFFNSFNGENNIDEKNLLIFQILFSYEYFHLFHKCLSKSIENIGNENYGTFTELLNFIKTKN